MAEDSNGDCPAWTDSWVDVDAEDSREASSVFSKECVSAVVIGIDEPFTRTILRREGMSGTTLPLGSGQVEEVEDEPNRKYPDGGTMKPLLSMPEVPLCP